MASTAPCLNGLSSRTDGRGVATVEKDVENRNRQSKPLEVPNHRTQFVDDQVEKGLSPAEVLRPNVPAADPKEGSIASQPLKKVEELLEDKDLSTTKKFELAKRLLNEGDTRQQLKAVEALSSCEALGARQIVEVLRWDDGDPGLQSFCRTKLFSSGTLSRFVARDLMQMYSAERDPAARATYLEILGKHSFTASEPLVLRSLQQGTSQVERDSAARVLLSRKNRGQYVEVLSEAVRDPEVLSPARRTEVLETLAYERPEQAAKLFRSMNASGLLTPSMIIGALESGAEPFLRSLREDLPRWSKDPDESLSRRALLARASLADGEAIDDLLEQPSERFSAFEERELLDSLGKHGTQKQFERLCQKIIEMKDRQGNIGDLDAALGRADALFAKRDHSCLEALPDVLRSSFEAAVDEATRNGKLDARSQIAAVRMACGMSVRSREELLETAFVRSGTEVTRTALTELWPQLSADEQNAWTKAIFRKFPHEPELLTRLLEVSAPPKGNLRGDVAADILVNYLEKGTVRAALLGVVDEAKLPLDPYFSIDELAGAKAKLSDYVSSGGSVAAPDKETLTNLGGYLRIEPEDAHILAQKFLESEEAPIRATGVLLCLYNRDPDAKKLLLQQLMRPNEGFSSERSVVLEEVSKDPRNLRQLLAELEAASTSKESVAYVANLRRCLSEPALNIANPLRFDPEALEEILRVKALDPQKDDRPVVRILGAVHDHNGACVTDGAMVRSLLAQREIKDGVERCKFRIEYDEIRGPGLARGVEEEPTVLKTAAGERFVPSMLDICAKDPQRKPAVLLVLSPHGTHEALSFSEGDPEKSAQPEGQGMFLTTDRRALAEAGVGQTLSERGSVLVVACSAGQGGRASGVFNVGDSLREVFPQAKKLQIVSPSVPTNIEDLKVEPKEDGTIEIRALFLDSGMYLSQIKSLLESSKAEWSFAA